MISYHFIMVIQVATIVAELAHHGVEMKTGAKDVVEVVEAGVLLVPSLPTISVSHPVTCPEFWPKEFSPN